MTTRRQLAWVCAGIAVAITAPTVRGDFDHEFYSYHAYCVYGEDADPNVQDVFRNDAYGMAGRFGAAGYDTHIYGPGEGQNLLDALNDMLTLSQTYANELLVFYYSDHGDYYDPVYGSGGYPDVNGDESQTEDPLPPGLPADEWDEGLTYNSVTDDDFGWYMGQIQENSCWVSGIIEACGANGLLDGDDDVQGWLGKESLWMTSEMEWYPSLLTDPNTPGHGPLTYGLLNAAGGPGATLGDMWNWFWNGADDYSLYLDGEDTWGIKLYEEDLSSYKWYIPEPATGAVLAFVGLLAMRCRRAPS